MKVLKDISHFTQKPVITISTNNDGYITKTIGFYNNRREFYHWQDAEYYCEMYCYPNGKIKRIRQYEYGKQYGKKINFKINGKIVIDNFNRNNIEEWRQDPVDWLECAIAFNMLLFGVYFIIFAGFLNNRLFLCFFISLVIYALIIYHTLIKYLLLNEKDIREKCNWFDGKTAENVEVKEINILDYGTQI